MELRHLRYFVAAAEELHFGRAAERCFVAQPALSKQIANLERELGVRLFHRIKRRVELTDAGEAFLPEALAVLERAARAGEIAARAGRGEVGHLNVGFTGMALYSILPEIVRSFEGRYSGVEISLEEGCSGTLTHGLRDGRLDVGLLHPPVEDKGLVPETIHSEGLVVALPEGHRLSDLPEVPLSDLAEDSFVFCPRDEAPALYDELIALCRSAGFSPKIKKETGLPQTVIGLVAAGVGVSLVWESMRSLQRPGVVYRPLEGCSPRLETAVVRRRDDRSTALAAFVEMVRETGGAFAEKERWRAEASPPPRELLPES